jgi:O-methyltransferase
VITVADLVRIRPYTVVDDARLLSLMRLVREADRRQIPGDVVECGVARGGSAAVMAAVTSRHCWLYDSCQGLPAPQPVDGPEAPAYTGANQTTPQTIAAALTTLQVAPARVTLRAGWFEDTFLWPGPSLIAVLHIDADWYDSVWICLHTWYDYVVPGGVIVLDDYGFWPGCRQAYADFIAARHLTPDLQRVGDQAWWQK